MNPTNHETFKSKIYPGDEQASNNMDDSFNKAKWARELRLQKSCLEQNNSFCDFRSPEAIKNMDENKMWDLGFKIGSKFSSNSLLDTNNSNMYKYGPPSLEKWDAKSPYFKFGFQNTPTPYGNVLQTPNNHPFPTYESQFFPTPLKSTQSSMGGMRKVPDSFIGGTPMSMKFPQEEPKPVEESSQGQLLGQNSLLIATIDEPTLSQTVKPKANAARGGVNASTKVQQVSRKPKRKNLSSREDVMNKNTFRAIKRQLKMMYTAYIGSLAFLRSEEAKQDTFIGKVTSFGEHLLNTTDVNSTGINFNRKDFITYLAIMLDYCQMKKIIKTAADKVKLDATFNVIYSYSHQKFYEYLKINEVKVVFKVIFNQISIEAFIEGHDTLKIAANRDKYHTHINNLLNKL